MNISTVIEDNVTEVLTKIREFTRRRRELIAENILNVNTAGYQPKDLDAEEFAELMTHAISEHIRNNRLVLCDGDSIHFGPNGDFQVEPVLDAKAKQLLACDSKAYLRYQFKKLTETLLNNQVAGGLLTKKEREMSPPRYFS